MDRLTHRPSGRGSLTVALLAGLLLTTGCGGDDDDNGAASPDDATPSTPSTSETVTQEEPPEATGPVRIGILPKGPEWGYLGMAQELGLYDAYGVEVEFIDLRSAEQAFPALFSGEVDAIYQSPGGVFVAAATGQTDVSIIAAAAEGLPWAIYGRAELNGLSDLEGRSIAISAPTGLPAIIVREMLRAEGVDPDSATYVNAGSNPDRYRAVVSGQVDAASAPADYVPRAEADGVKVLATSWDVLPNYPRFEIIARNGSLEDNPGGFVRYLAAFIEGLQYAADNPDEARALAVTESGVEADDPVVDYTLDLIGDEGLI